MPNQPTRSHDNRPPRCGPTDEALPPRKERAEKSVKGAPPKQHLVRAQLKATLKLYAIALGQPYNACPESGDRLEMWPHEPPFPPLLTDENYRRYGRQGVKHLQPTLVQHASEARCHGRAGPQKNRKPTKGTPPKQHLVEV